MESWRLRIRQGGYSASRLLGTFMPYRLLISRAMSTIRTASACRNISDFSACELSDALVKLGLPHGGHIPDIHMLSPEDQSTRICGPAYTVKMVAGTDNTAPKLEKHFVDTATPESIVIIDVPAGPFFSMSHI